jgi:hypothetical protein
MNFLSKFFANIFRLFVLLGNEKKAREETEEAFLDMLRSIINKIKTELENERRERYIKALTS